MVNYGSGIVPKGDFFGLPGGYVSNYVWANQKVKGLILDAGCGYGYGSNYIAQQSGNTVVGVDNDPKAINYAKKNYKRNNLTFMYQDIMELTFNQKFDAIVSLEVLEHMLHPQYYIEKVAGMLKPKGQFLLATPNRSYTEHFYINGKSINFYHINECYPFEVEQMLVKYFKIKGIFRHYHPDSLLSNIDVEAAKKQWSKEIKIPLFIRKNLPQDIKQLVRVLMGKPKDNYNGCYHEYKIEEVSSIYGIDQFPGQMYHCILE